MNWLTRFLMKLVGRGGSPQPQPNPRPRISDQFGAKVYTPTPLHKTLLAQLLSEERPRVADASLKLEEAIRDDPTQASVTLEVALSTMGRECLRQYALSRGYSAAWHDNELRLSKPKPRPTAKAGGEPTKT